VLDDRSALILLPGPVGREVREQLIEQVRLVLAEPQSVRHLVHGFAATLRLEREAESWRRSEPAVEENVILGGLCGGTLAFHI